MNGQKKVFLTPLTGTATTDKEGVGTIRWEGNKCYKWVLYDDGTGNLDIVAGDVLVYKAINYKNSVVTADLTDADTLPVGAGLAVTTVTADQTYMWMQIKGPATLSLDPTGSSPGDGDRFSAGATTSGTDKAAVIDPGANLTVMGTTIDDSAKEVALDCLF